MASPPMSSEPCLIVRDSSERRIELSQQASWRLGRSPDNDIVLDGGMISRSHAMIQRIESGRYVLIDLGSRNGSLVNGRRVTAPTQLRDGDRVALGKADLLFHEPRLAPAPGTDAGGLTLAHTTALCARKITTILVADLRDFTVLTRRISAELLTELISTWFRRCARAIESHGGFIDKYIGDAIMAAWFHDERSDHHPEQMLQVLRSIEALDQHCQQLNAQFDLPMPIRFGVGLNTGPTIVSNTGTAQRADYTALGDTVNAAFRFESCSRQLGVDVVMGKSCHDCITQLELDAMPFKPRRVELKGYDEQVPVFVGSFQDLSRLLASIQFDESEPIQLTDQPAANRNDDTITG